MNKESYEMVEKYYKNVISSQKLVSWLRENEILSNEEVYKKYFNIGPKIGNCRKFEKFSGFKRGFVCCEKCFEEQRMGKLSTEELINEFIDLYPRVTTKKYEKFLSKVFFNKRGKELTYLILNKINKLEVCDIDGCNKFKMFSVSSNSYSRGCCKSHTCILNHHGWNNKSKEKLLLSLETHYSSIDKAALLKRNLKHSKTKTEKNKDLNYVKMVNKKRERTCINRYGVNNISKLQSVKKKKEESFYKHFGVSNYFKVLTQDKSHINRVREINEQNGRWLTYDQLEDKREYEIKVRRLTEKQNLESLENFHLRGPVDKNGWHLDHIYSIFDGFKNNIPIYITANINNLRMIPARENQSKKHRSDIYITDLIDKIVLSTDKNLLALSGEL